MNLIKQKFHAGDCFSQRTQRCNVRKEYPPRRRHSATAARNYWVNGTEALKTVAPPLLSSLTSFPVNTIAEG